MGRLVVRMAVIGVRLIVNNDPIVRLSADHSRTI